MPFPPPEEPISSWRAFEEAVASLDPDGTWVFRGVLNSWDPLTSLERVKRAWDLPTKDLPRLEARLTRDFRRHPEGADALGDLAGDITFTWALMQHHGAPTRLMDWTYSPYVAAFFAFDELLLQMSTLTTEQQSAFPDKATVWALNTSWLNSKLREKLPSATYEALCEKKTQPDQFERILTESPFTRFICTANPMVLNQRLSLQQGVFLCPGDVTRSWQENLDELDWSPSAAISRRLTLNLETTEAFKHLHRMNVTARSLFPGLDGYGKFIFGRAKLLLDLELMGE